MPTPTYARSCAAGVWLAGARSRRLIAPLLAAAGVVLGLAHLGAPEAALYLVALLIVALDPAVRDRTWLGWTPWIGSGLVGFALMAAPYLVYLRRSLGHWTLSGKVAHNLVLDLGPRSVVRRWPIRRRWRPHTRSRISWPSSNTRSPSCCRA